MITQEQKQKLINLNDSRVNEILEVKEYGKWYKCKGFPKYLAFMAKEGRFGFNTNGDWFDLNKVVPDLNNVCWIKATNEEVEQALVCFLQKKLLLY